LSGILIPGGGARYHKPAGIITSSQEIVNL
jgi:hypothetical protein